MNHPSSLVGGPQCISAYDRNDYGGILKGIAIWDSSMIMLFFDFSVFLGFACWCLILCFAITAFGRAPELQSPSHSHSGFVGKNDSRRSRRTGRFRAYVFRGGSDAGAESNKSKKKKKKEDNNNNNKSSNSNKSNNYWIKAGPPSRAGVR